jgi:hypothetical protein
MHQKIGEGAFEAVKEVHLRNDLIEGKDHSRREGKTDRRSKQRDGGCGDGT